MIQFSRVSCESPAPIFEDANMETLAQIVAAAKGLKPAEFVKLRKELDRLEHRLWIAELSTATSELRKAGIDDRQIDQMVARRRRESRS